MKRMFLLPIALFILLAAGALARYLIQPLPSSRVLDNGARPVVSIQGRNFNVDVADTMALQSQGLSGRESLGENEGMFFIFSGTGTHGFWMRNMLFPIDIVWILDDRVVGVEENVQPEPEKNMFMLTKYYPPEPVNRVLEVSAGTVTKYGFKAGDAVEFFPIKSN